MAAVNPQVSSAEFRVDPASVAAEGHIQRRPRLTPVGVSGSVHDMSLEAWWPLLPPATRDWLIANNGDRLSASVLDDIAQVGGPPPADAWWVGSNGPNGCYLSDAGMDWIETVANAEVPDPPPSS